MLDSAILLNLAHFKAKFASIFAFIKLNFKEIL